MYLILNFFLQNLFNIYVVMTISFCLTPKYSRLRSLTVYLLISLFIYTIKLASFDNQLVLSLSIFLIQLSLILFSLLAFTDSVFKKLIVFSSILLGNIIAERVSLLILNAIASYEYALKPDTKEFAIAVILTFPVQIALNQTFLFFWKYAVYKKSALTIFVFPLVPMFQLLIVFFLFIPSILEGTAVNTPLIILCSIIALLANIVLLYVILRRQEKKSIEAAFLELQEVYRMESEYYQTLEERHEELSKIRHDYNNHLAALYVLISSNKMEAANELAASMKKALHTGNDS